MLDKKRKRIDPNNSKVDSGKAKVLKILHQLYNGDGGTISYVFFSERIRFTRENPLGEAYRVKSIQHSNINSEVFYKLENHRLMRRSPEEVLQVFEDTKNDLGASYFIIG